MITMLFSNQRLQERQGMGMEAAVKQSDHPAGARPASYRSAGWWPRPWPMRRCHQSSRTCRASSDARPASLGPALQQSRRTQWEWLLQSCQEVKRTHEIRAWTAMWDTKGRAKALSMPPLYPSITRNVYFLSSYNFNVIISTFNIGSLSLQNLEPAIKQYDQEVAVVSYPCGL